MKTTLFLCTGNYYRSRFAEEVFNFQAIEKGIQWRADSAGLKVKETRHENKGTISPHAMEGFKRFNIEPIQHGREPKDVDETHLRESDLIIATSLAEHKPMIQELIPEYMDKIIFWEVEDIEFETPGKALPRLQKAILALVDQLA